MITITRLVPVTLIVMVLSVWPALADEVAIPHDFEAKTPAVAQEVNDNFNAVATAINDNDNRLDAMSSGYVSVSALTAVPKDSTFETNWSSIASGLIGRYGVSSGEESLVAPLFIPDGATITSISFTCYDNDATYDSVAYIERDDNLNVTPYISTTSSSETAQTVSTTDITHPTVDNALYGYFVHMSVNGTAGTDLMPIRVVVGYALSP